MVVCLTLPSVKDASLLVSIANFATVFSASLVFAANLVVDLASSGAQDSAHNDLLREYMRKASDCLDGLDGDVVILSRCKQYIERLSHTLIEYGKTMLAAS